MTEKQDDSHNANPAAAGTPPMCTCIQDPFGGLPPELRPKPQPKKSGLRQATCPSCGLKYWTNRATDLCIECEKKGVQIPGTGSGG